ncbi:MliC family protein [Phenylobacterium sp.]|uniref:MliC family protein n=1 Tax=Phenylobacterium sp. TaxID=1871053 RepID=UPI00272EFF35|nr:MliC family protein [Phenylobacterium sp.]MDP1875203.1 MliC family protein [Phenylobacterium sp.]
MSHKALTTPFRPVALIALSALWLGACEAPANPPAATATPVKALAAAPAAKPLGQRADLSAMSATYRCANGERLKVSYRTQDAAMITYRGETRFLPLARSASGARYAGDGWQWWIKGEAEGTLSRLTSDAAVAPGAGVVCKVEIAPPPATHVRAPEK